MGNPKATNSQAARKGKPVVFIVDDEPMLLELAAKILSPHGYFVKTFADPAEALHQFKASDPKPDLIITDYAMHRLNGLSLIQECRQVSPKQKVIMVSGTADESVFAHVPIKPDRFLPKPYRTDELIDLVKSVLKD